MARYFAAAAAIVVVISVAAVWLTRDYDVVDAGPIRLESIGADVFYLDCSEITHRGSGRVVVVRIDGPVELVPYHYEAEGLESPQPIEAWQTHLRSPLVFNAGQFDEDFNHLGWLKSDGAWLSEYRKPQWMGLLLSGPVDGAAWARVADLEQADPSVEARYRHAVQSMMLVDDEEKIRVRDTDKNACRTVVGEDQLGRLLIIVTEGAVTLGDFARWLPQQGLGLVRAMNLDGGIESQLAVRTPELDLRLYGQYGTGATVFEGSGTIEYPLPAVVALRPAKPPSVD